MATFVRSGGLGDSTIPTHPPRGGRLLGPAHVLMGERVQVRLLRLAGLVHVAYGPTEGIPAAIIATFFTESERPMATADLGLPILPDVDR